MVPPTRRRASRVLLWGWAIFSLLLIAWTGLLFVTSVPIEGEAAAAMAHGDARHLREGDRIVLEPVASPDDVTTLGAAEEDHSSFGARGDVLHYAPVNGSTRSGNPLFPFGTPPGEVARALAYVTRNESSGNWDAPALGLSNVTSLNVTMAPAANATGAFAFENATVDLTALDGTAGFVVKADGAPASNASLVPLDRVHGRVARVLAPSQLWQALVLSVLGLLAPLALIIVSHRGRGTAGVPGPGGVGGGPACAECGRPLEPGLGFCSRCGAIAKR